MSNELETIDGFNIPIRPLTEEEATREVTVQRFKDWHAVVGEGFMDDHGGGNIPYKIFGGFLLAKRPDLNKEICDILNDQFGEMLSFEHLIEDQHPGEDVEWEIAFNEFYGYVCEFVNLTTGVKKKINESLIILMEHYGK